MEVRIDSTDPSNTPGEILCRGLNVMLGYYKNEEATQQAIDKDGWYHTGDLGVMDEDGNVFIKGRSKYMLLSANGQNIYPEEIEDKLNSMAMVNESIVIQENDKLVGLVHPDLDEAQAMGFTNTDLENIMEQNRKDLNNTLPAYSKISSIRIHNEEFEKTPKKSIKRFLYINQ
jgi:long-chain acyl-CoA synthetase